ncbi:hypothetical protein [Micromonospora sp. NPDC023737]|uniref:hypothetical protein n=1 Tax=unclassified Micromonospora TaxID=2617518 RepID=UPI0033FD492B
MVVMDSGLDTRRIAHPTQRIFTGRVVRFLEGYTREIAVGKPVLIAVLAAAGVGALLMRVVRAVLPGSGGGARRRWKDLTKGPEYLVTPVRLRDNTGGLYEVELHGHLPQSALHPADHVQLTLRPQRDPDLPPRIERIVNLTTGQLLTPRTATLWTHLGPPLLLQAMLGLLLVLGVAAWSALT